MSSAMSGPGRKIAVLQALDSTVLGFRGHLLQEMVARGHDVEVYLPSAAPPVVEGLRAIGVSCLQIGLNRTGISPVVDLESLNRLRTRFKATEVDLVFGCSAKPVIYGSFAARVARVPDIFSLVEGLGYAFSSTDLRARCLRLLVAQLYRMSLSLNRKVFFLNPDDRELFCQMRLVRGQEQCVLLNGIGVDLSAFRPAPLPARPTVLMIARLLKDKGVREYVAAARIVRAKYPDVAFHLLGRQDSHPDAITDRDLQAWVQEGLIEYLGWLDDVRPAIAACTLFVLPSYREGTPRTTMEALAMGRPVVTTDVPGCRETVEHGSNGYLVPARDVPALARAIEHFITHPEEAAPMGQASRRLAENRYDVRAVDHLILQTMGL
jgi:glycosyltransferase involved in cell wall biosynthesis